MHFSMCVLHLRCTHAGIDNCKVVNAMLLARMACGMLQPELSVAC